MVRIPARALFLFLAPLIPLAASPAVPPVVCPAGAPIGAIDLWVRSARGPETLPLRTINRLQEGDSVLYRPLLRPSEKRLGDVALVLVPAIRQPDRDGLIVLEPKRADQPQEWAVPFRASIAGYVYGPSGLSKRSVHNFLLRDEELISQLADYAEKTAQTEALIQALSNDTSSGESVDAAFNGFASKFGTGGQLDRTQPANQQMMALFRSMNPVMAGYDPISPQPSQRIGQTAALATSVAALFFGSPVGLAAGGTAMVMQMRALAFPNTAFRSSFAQPIAGDGLALCGKRDAVPMHTRVAYLWASRIPNAPPPHVKVGAASTLPVGLRSQLPVELGSDEEWKNIDHARDWALIAADGKSYPVVVKKLPELKVLETDLGASKAPTGKYRLAANWDWDQFLADGAIYIEPLNDFTRTRLAAESQDRLLARSGKVALTLEGGDAEFVTRVEVEKPGDKFFTSASIPFVLPFGPRRGVQNHFDIQINTAELDPGDYRLEVFQPDGKPHAVPFQVLSEPPHIDNLPISLNRGDDTREVVLRGQRLDQLTRLDTARGTMILSPSSTPGERRVMVKVDASLPAGTSTQVKAWIEGRAQPIVFADALRILGPRPAIQDAKVSTGNTTDVDLRTGELPSGVVASVLLKVGSLGQRPSLTLQCEADDSLQVTLRAGQKSGTASLQVLSPKELFLTFDTGVFPGGCALQAMVSDADGRSDPQALGHVIRLPRIESIQIAPDASEATLTGQDLETIEKTGWTASDGVPTAELPAPVPGSTQTATLKIHLAGAAPAKDAPLYVWLRGEEFSRAARVKGN